MKESKTHIDGEIYHVLVLDELIYLKWIYHPKQSIDSSNNSQTTNNIFQKTRTDYFMICMETHKTLKNQSNFEKVEWN